MGLRARATVLDVPVRPGGRMQHLGGTRGASLVAGSLVHRPRQRRRQYGSCQPALAHLFRGRSTGVPCCTSSRHRGLSLRRCAFSA